MKSLDYNADRRLDRTLKSQVAFLRLNASAGCESVHMRSRDIIDLHPKGQAREPLWN